MSIPSVRIPRPMTVRAGGAAVPVVGPGPLRPAPSPVTAPSLVDPPSFMTAPRREGRREGRVDRSALGAFRPVPAGRRQPRGDR